MVAVRCDAESVQEKPELSVLFGSVKEINSKAIKVLNTLPTTLDMGETLKYVWSLEDQVDKKLHGGQSSESLADVALTMGAILGKLDAQDAKESNRNMSECCTPEVAVPVWAEDKTYGFSNWERKRFTKISKRAYITAYMASVSV